MERFARDPASQYKDYMIDTTTGESLRVRFAKVSCADSQKREYVADFGSAHMPFHPEDEIFDIPYEGITRRKVLLSSTGQADDPDSVSSHLRVAAIEDHSGSGHYIACTTPS